MFTGLIEKIGQIKKIQSDLKPTRLSIKTPFSKSLKIGESVAVNGVCLTVNKKKEDSFDIDIMPETLNCTTLGSLQKNDLVNLERALKLNDRLGGHFVQGHVDGVGTTKNIQQNKNGYRITIIPPPSLKKYIAHKGSIAVDGVSLTVSKLNKASFEIALIPHTLKNTTLARLKKNDKVNLEIDLLTRYLEHLQT